MILVDADHVTVARPDKVLFGDLSLTVEDGDRLGIVGINGCGKSTLLRVLSGDATPEGGVVRRGRGVRIAVLPQEPRLAPGPVRISVVAGLEGAATWEAEAVLDRLGMGAMLDADVATLSGGQAKRVALARALVTESDLLVLDEPTNHLDLDAISWLEERLARYRGGLLLVTHDRHVLDRVCTKVLELDRGKGYLHEGGYQGYLDGRAAREERAEVAEAVRRNLAKTELAWLRRGAPARTRKPKAHIASATALVEGRREAPARRGGLELGAATGRSGEGRGAASTGSFRKETDERLAPRLGNKVAELTGIGHRFTKPDGTDGPWLFRGFDWILDPGARYGIVGANGSGKSTLLDLISGRRAPVEGTFDLGVTVRVGYYDQLGRTLDPNQRVREAVAGPNRVPGTPEDKKLMEQFWFEADAQFAPVGTLSGGERRRLQLLLVLAERPNVLLLDEPTNDLDLDTLRALEEFLEDWPGTLVVVSHDRAFMDRTVEEVVAIEGGRAAEVAGGYAGWRAARDARTRSGANTSAPSVAAPATAPTPSPSSSASSPASGSGARASAGAPAEKKRSKSTVGFQLREAEKEMARLTRERDRAADKVQSVLSDHVALAAASAELADVQGHLDAVEERWLELAAEAEG